MYVCMYHFHWVGILNEEQLYITECRTAVFLFCIIAGFPTLLAGIRVNIPSLKMLCVNEISAKAPECWCVILPVLNLKS
jgi:hypothetical protein